jgi:molybdenum cofactor cytidylyltransferase
VTADPSDRVGAVVLAAGRARRFGAPKLLLPFRRSTVLGCVVAAIQGAGVETIVVVTAADREAIGRALRGTDCLIVQNPDPDRGMLSSVRVGVEALPADLDRILLALGDQPRLAAEDVAHLLRQHARAGRGIALPTYRGKRGHPVVFKAAYRARLLSLDDRHTLRDLVHARPDDVAEVQCRSDAVIRDIDTKADYENEIRHSLPE